MLEGLIPASKARNAKGDGRWQPLEDGKVTVSRAAGSVTFPSEFMGSVLSNGYFSRAEPVSLGCEYLILRTDPGCPITHRTGANRWPLC